MAWRATPRRFRLFNAHLDEYLSENYVKSRFCFGRDSINYLADLLSDDLARNIAFRYVLPSPWALTIRPKIPGRISRNFHGQMVQSFPVWKTLIVRLEFFKSTSWLFIDHNSRDLAQTTTAAKTSQNKGFNESYNGSARVINICTFPSQPICKTNKYTTGALFL